jgi:hypothetical protein
MPSTTTTRVGSTRSKASSTLFEGVDVADKELALERVGVVEVLLATGVERELREVAVVEVKREEGGVELVGEFAREGGLARAGTPGDADDDGLLGEMKLGGLSAHASSVFRVRCVGLQVCGATGCVACQRAVTHHTYATIAA